MWSSYATRTRRRAMRTLGRTCRHDISIDAQSAIIQCFFTRRWYLRCSSNCATAFPVSPEPLCSRPAGIGRRFDRLPEHLELLPRTRILREHPFKFGADVDRGGVRPWSTGPACPGQLRRIVLLRDDRCSPAFLRGLSGRRIGLRDVWRHA